MPHMGGTTDFVLGGLCVVEHMPPSSVSEAEALLGSTGLKLAESPLERDPSEVVVIDDDDDGLLDFVLPYEAAPFERVPSKDLALVDLCPSGHS